MEHRLDFLLRNGKSDYVNRLADFEQELEQELARFRLYYQTIAQANEPSILPEDVFPHLQEIRALAPFSIEGRELTLLTDEEFLALSVQKGSLTDSERLEIQSHVKHTFKFLSTIPWTSELKRVPGFALAHHEKLNGSGYPHGWTCEQIPLESKIMTVSDIFDALTASDRPYKRAVSREKALDILLTEAKRELLDPDLVKIFIEAKIFKKTKEPPPANIVYGGFAEDVFKRSVCDFEMYSR